MESVSSALMWLFVTKSFCWVIWTFLPSICPSVVTSSATIDRDAPCKRPDWLSTCKFVPLIETAWFPVISPCWLLRECSTAKWLSVRLWILPCWLSIDCAEIFNTEAKIPSLTCSEIDFVSRLSSFAVFIIKRFPLSINDPDAPTFWLLISVVTFNVSLSFVRISPPRLSTLSAKIVISPNPWILPFCWLSTNPVTWSLPCVSA